MRFEQSWQPLILTLTARMTATAEEIENEPMFYNAGPALIAAEAGPITRRFIVSIAGVFENCPHDWSLDTRSHMLMRGWYPAIPGWHHDDVDRGANGQPDYDQPISPERSMVAVVVDASDQPTGSMTEFMASGSTVSVPWPVPADAPVYRYWDAHIEQECTAPRTVLESGRIVTFGPSDFHRAMPATTPGWRWFARLTLNPGPRPAEGKIRRQAQVYLPVTNSGW